MLFQLAFSLICLALGASGGYVAGLFKIGWWLGNDDDSVKARESLKNLNDLTSRMTGQVEAHARRVETAQQELSDAQTNEQGSEEALARATEALQSANEQLQAELRKAKRDLERQQSELQSHRRDARTDGLTQLLNRRAFDEEMTRLSDQATLLLLDIDHFKSFNDTYGHQLGDRVLRHVADTVRKTLSGMDVIAARYGGEEFAVILLSGSLTMAARTAEELRAAIEAASLRHEGKSLSITLSIGLCQSADELSTEEVISRSDAALYAAKRGGRNRGYYHNGAECLAIADLLARPARVQTAPPVEPEAPINEALAELEATIAEATASALSPTTDRRRHERRPYSRMHLFAPIIGGKVPTPDMFAQVQFLDLSASGFGIVLPQAPTFKNFVVALDKADGTVYALAEVVRTRRRQPEEGLGTDWEIGCRFMGKLQSPKEPAQLASSR